jgi:SAM-dependent methyltransferase
MSMMLARSSHQEESRSAFEALAREYYDPDKHPTCANFRAASRLLLVRWLQKILDTPACEVGSGSSLLAEILVERDYPLQSVTLTDVSPKMLAHSLRFKSLGAGLEIAAANELPFSPDTQAMVVSSLGDPYNNLEFWEEAARVLIPRGHIFFSTPSFEWAAAYRIALPQPLQARAEFEATNGKNIWIPSVVLPEEKQKNLIESAGFEVVSIEFVSLRDLQPPISSKLSVLNSAQAAVVTGYLARKC